MNKKRTQQKERGQSLVLVALAMVGLLAFVGLALDGGLAYATRRVAQNAADSGSIAGTYELHRQKWEEGLDAGLLSQNLILSEIHQVVEAHDVPDTDGIPGNEINDNVRAFFVGRGAGGYGCSNAVDTEYVQLCEFDADNPCNANAVQDSAVGISIEVDMPFQPIFAAFIGLNEIKVSNRSNSFDQRTAAIVHAEDTGFNRDLWAIFTMVHGETTGPSTFIGVDPVAVPPAGFAFSNVHSQGSFSVGNTPAIMGQVTYCTPGGCSNCDNALILPEEIQKNIKLPDFNRYATVALARAQVAGGTVIDGDATWGELIANGLPFFAPEGVVVINGDLIIPEGTFGVGQNLFIYVRGNVRIDGLFSAQNMSIISDGTIEIKGALQNIVPFDQINNDPDFNQNGAVLWSNSSSANAIDITGEIFNDARPFISTGDVNIGGAVMAPNSNVNISSNNINITVRGTVIGQVVSINSSPDTGRQTRILYNGSYFPNEPNRIELLK